MKPARRLVRASLLAAFVVTIVSCGGAEDRKAKYLERGKDYLARENYDKAAVEIKNALQIDPRHAEAFYLLGEVELKRGDFSRAFSAYARAVELDPGHLEAQIAVARFYLLWGDVAKATETADLVLAKRAGDLDARVIKAMIQSHQGNVQAALNEAADVLAVEPGHTQAAEFISAIRIGLKQTDKAIEVLERAVAANAKKNLTLRPTLAEIYAAQKQLDKAEEQYRAMIAAQPDVLRHRALLARFLGNTDQVDKAEAVLREAVRANPKDPQRYVLLAELLAQRRGPEQAEKALTEAVRTLPDEMSLRFALGTLYETMKRPDKASDVYRTIITASGVRPDGLKARTHLAQILFTQGKAAEAEALIKEVLEENPRDNMALLLKGRRQLLRGDATGATNSFRTVLKDQPENAEVLALLAQAHMAGKEPALAEESLKKAIEVNPGYITAHLRLAELMANRKDLDGALKELDKALVAAPDDLRVLQAMAQTHIAKGDSKNADAAIAKIESAHASEPAGLVIAASLRATQQKPELALRDLDQAYKLAPTAAEPITGIVKLLLAQGEPDKAIARLEEAVRATPDNAVAYNLLGELRLSRKEYAEAEKAFRHANEILPKWSFPYRNLAMLRAGQGDSAGAVGILEQGLKAAPEDPELLVLLANLYEQKGDHIKARDAQERILKRSPRNVTAAKKP